MRKGKRGLEATESRKQNDDGGEDGGGDCGRGGVCVSLLRCTHTAREQEASVVINHNLCGQKGQEGHA